jgi:23S rRNA pseudouridine1911/1915/1917 synthase
MKNKENKNECDSNKMKDIPGSIQYLFEDRHLVAVVKPFGMLTQSGRRGGASIFDRVREYIGGKYGSPDDIYLGLLHRLDRPVGGVILFAKTPDAARRLSAAFREREVKKTYIARIEGALEPPSGKLCHHLLKSGTKAAVAPEGTPGAKEAVLIYRTFKSDHDAGESLVEVDLITGRRHQVRAQLSAAGHPVLGDVKYGSKNRFIPGAIALFSMSLVFAHPVTGEEITISAEPPEEFFTGL